ncbi:LuxR C-terminal-related transcriptional regulator [Croceicoccus sp. F390]|uniref:LuxR C-terminal-related transcriptional regulator n=1 Tax=Croceicoccus esteveae TaxID=3075597 RepID=A0ABU2ZHU7_9SPHN|nr:LuxR C-terminal-related transcriptional regulator [Croceicoccus sp. F390]MDT0576177.1 LuxR C-terminal-related transcriptional regulator [Croceicoccus sp. F390]
MAEHLTVHIVHPEPLARATVARSVFDLGDHAEVYADLGELLDRKPPRGVVLWHDDPAHGTLADLVNGLSAQGCWLPVIAMAHNPDIGRVVAAIRAGALAYLDQPVDQALLRLTLDKVAKEAVVQTLHRRRAAQARQRLATLSVREKEVLDLLAQGCSNKIIARDLAISPRTVEIHRGNMMEKLGAGHVAHAVRMQLEASLTQMGY